MVSTYRRRGPPSVESDAAISDKTSPRASRLFNTRAVQCDKRGNGNGESGPGTKIGESCEDGAVEIGGGGSNQERCRSWTKEEDLILCEAVRENPAMKWSCIASTITGRSSHHCRERWYNCLDPNINKGEWSPSEDSAVLKTSKEKGNRWVEVSKNIGTGWTGDLVKCRTRALLSKEQKIKFEMQGGQTSIKQSKDPKRLDFEILNERTSSLKKNIDTNKDECNSSEDSAILKLNKQLGNKWVEIPERLGTGQTGDLVKVQAQVLLSKEQRIKFEMVNQQTLSPQRIPDTNTYVDRQKRMSSVPKGRGLLSVSHHKRAANLARRLYFQKKSTFHPSRLGSCRFRQLCCCQTNFNSSKWTAGAVSVYGRNINAILPSFHWPHNDISFCRLPYPLSRYYGTPVPLGSLFQSRGHFLETSVSPIKGSKVRTAVVPDASICFVGGQIKKTSTKADIDLLKTWKDQSRRRKKGEWRPTGGWKAPKWASLSHALISSPIEITGGSIPNSDNASMQMNRLISNTASGAARSSTYSCGRILAIRVADLITANLLPSMHDRNEFPVSVISSLNDVRYPAGYQVCARFVLILALSLLFSNTTRPFASWFGWYSMNIISWSNFCNHIRRQMASCSPRLT